ncbi:hypothetical protein [Agrococcus beijingensis]|uniref:hypothetical protein n=1 Tax=Agrococcus beijingensis TaxID=3068634 RepID=UPI002740860D|nr:hypothetical protein [Agrococcus sp. REN33]
MKLITTHRCTDPHDSAADMLACIYPRARHIDGAGDYAVLNHCGRGQAITLHATEDAAEDALDRLDRNGCGNACESNHASASVLWQGGGPDWQGIAREWEREAHDHQTEAIALRAQVALLTKEKA